MSDYKAAAELERIRLVLEKLLRGQENLTKVIEKVIGDDKCVNVSIKDSF